MAYLPPPPAPPPVPRRPPRWSGAPSLQEQVSSYSAGDHGAGRRIRRILAPALAAIAEAARGGRSGRQQAAQNAVTLALRDLEINAVPPEAVPVAFTAVAHVLDGLEVLPPRWLGSFAPWRRAVGWLLDVELADETAVARSLGVESEDLHHARDRLAFELGIAPPRESPCPGWSDVRASIRGHGDGDPRHRDLCGRCSMVAAQTLARRRRLWSDVASVGAIGAAFDPRRR